MANIDCLMSKMIDVIKCSTPCISSSHELCRNF